MRFLFCLCLSLAASVFAHGQWSVVYADTTGSTLRDIQFISSTTGFVLKDDVSGIAQLLKTTDAGTTWTQHPLPATYAHKVHFVDSLKGHVMQGGAPVRLMSTTDGGLTWSGQNLDSSFIVVGFGMPKPDIGFYMNNAGRFRKFKLSGGIASLFYLSDTLRDGTNLHFTDSLHGFSPQWFYVHRTTDGGSNWFGQPTGIGEDIYGPAFHFATAQRGYLGSRDSTYLHGGIWRTSDAGVSWSFADDFTAISLHAHGDIALAVDDSMNAAISIDAGATWWHEPLGLPLTSVAEAVAEVTPGGDLFVTTAYDGRILKRTTSLAQTDRFPERRWVVYPNPATQSLHMAGLPDGTQVSLFNLLGEVVLRGASPTLNVDALPAGMYVLRAAGESRRVMIR
jgi:hypothetical protein